MSLPATVLDDSADFKAHFTGIEAANNDDSS
jgi:hypothetical protein